MTEPTRGLSARPSAVRSFLIADIRGYTRFTAEHGDEEATRLASKFAEVAGEGIEAWGGALVETRGDEVLAAFDSPRQAIRCAVELQAAFAAEIAFDPTLPLAVGIGLAAGEAVPVGDGYRGAALNLAARLCAAAGGGEIIASIELVHLAGSLPGIQFVNLGPTELKGLKERVEAVRISEAVELASPVRATDAAAEYLVEAPLPPELDPIVPLAGRTSDLRWLAWHWRRTHHGAGRVVIISGPPGIGKTRLAAELASRIHAEDAAVTYVPASRGAEALAAMPASGPALVIVDDIDAAPAGLMRAVTKLAQQLAGHRTLMLITHREETSPAVIALAERLASSERRRPLAPLGPDAVRAIAALYAGPTASALPLDEAFAETGGIPAAVHRWSSAWARQEAAERLGASAGRTSEGRRSLRAAEAQLVGAVAALELARDRTQLYGADQPAGDGEVSRPALDVCPYKGLAAFEAADAEHYFGRERLVAELVARLVGTGFLGMIGASGSGKSSALRAGLLPALSGGVLPGSDGWPQVVLRPGEHPLAELGRALARVRSPRRRKSDDPAAALDGVLTDLPSDRRLVVVVDQFEEVFNATRDDSERAAFIELLTSERDGLKVLIALRADHYGHCAIYPALAKTLASNQVLVGPPREHELAAVIEHPAQRVGLRVERGLTEALLDDLGNEPGSLPLLSTALLELWQARQDGRLTLAAYRASGGVHGAVARLAENAYANLEAGQQKLARSVFLRLAGPGEGEGMVRRRVPLSEFDVARDPDLAAVIEALTNSRLLTSGEGYIEVAHEALLREWPRLQGWLEEDAAGRQLRLHLMDAARDWESGGRESGDLYRGARLTAGLDWASQHDVDLNALEREFLEESRLASERDADRQRRTNRRLRTLLVGAAVFLVVAVGAGVFAAYQAQTALQAEEFARSRELAASALSVLDDDPTLSKLLALSAASIADPPVESVAALHRAWDADRVTYRYQWPEDRPVSNLITDLDPSGRYLVASGFLFDAPHNYVEVVDTESDQSLWSFAPADDSLAVGIGLFDPAGERVVFGVWREQAQPPGSDSSADQLGIHVRDALTGEEIERFDVGPCGAAVAGVSDTRVVVMTSPAPSCITWRGASQRRDIALEAVDFGTGKRTVLTPGDAIRGVRPSDEGAVSLDGRIVAFTEDVFMGDDQPPEVRSVVMDLESGTQLPVDLPGALIHDISGDGSRALWDHDGRLKVWDFLSGEVVAELPGNGSGIGCGLSSCYAQFGPDNQLVFGTGDDGMLRAWDVNTGGEIFAYPAPQGRPSATVRELVLVPALGTPTALLIDTSLRAELGAVDVLCEPADWPFQITGNYAVVDTFCDWTSSTSIFAAGEFSTHAPASIGPADAVRTVHGGYGVALSPDGTRLARQTGLGADDDLLVGPVEILDLVGDDRLELEGLCSYRRSRERHTHLPAENAGCVAYPGQPFPILAGQIRWSPDGNLIAIVDFLDGYIAVWDARDGRLIPASLSVIQPEAGVYGVFDVAFTSDSQHLLVSQTADRRTEPGFLHLVSTVTWTIERSRQMAIPGLRLTFAGLLSNDSTVLAASGFRGIGERGLYWIDTDTLEDTRPSRPRIHEGSLFSLVMSRDRSLLATGSSDGLVRVWDTATGRLDHEIAYAGLQVDGLAFVADRRLGVVLDDATLRLVTIDEAELLDIVRTSLTRGFTDAECERFNFEVCPTLEEMRESSPDPTPAATVFPDSSPLADPELEGLWETARLTRESMAATLSAAGLDPDGADVIAENEGFTDYIVYQVEIREGRWAISVFPDGESGGVGWEGAYEIIGQGTVTATERWCTITYEYEVLGDELTVDLIDDPCYPDSGELLFQAVIFESGPFTRIE